MSTRTEQGAIARAAVRRARLLSRLLRALPCLAILALVPACRASVPGRSAEISTWGTMREVLREGRSEARVALAGLAGPDAVGVGALEGLAGEVTVVEGRVLVARARAAPGPGGAPTRCEPSAAGADDRAALLVLADVPDWEEHELGSCADYGDLESAIAEVLRERGHDLAEALPVRVRGRAADLALHVLAGACPIANPSGPAPWRWRGAGDDVELVGFFAEGAAGRLTHHGRRSHLHAITSDAMGHLDEVALERAVLLLPVR